MSELGEILTPKPLVIKLAASIFALTVLLSLLPGRIANVVELVLLIALSGIFAIVLIAAHRDLNLFSLSTRKKGSTNNKRVKNKFRHVSYKGLDVSYTKELNGGGLGLSYEFVRLVSTHIGKVEHACEICAGPGFIGFNLLANNLCDKLTLCDVNPKAIEAINETIKLNQLEDRVTVYLSDCLDSIPKSESWDLVVSNPPWKFRTTDKDNLVLSDAQGNVHKRLFQGISQFLKPDSSILLVESHEYTRFSDITRFVDATKLNLIRYFRPIGLLSIFANKNEYKHTSTSMRLAGRLASFCLGTYYMHFKPVVGTLPRSE